MAKDNDQTKQEQKPETKVANSNRSDNLKYLLIGAVGTAVIGFVLLACAYNFKHVVNGRVEDGRLFGGFHNMEGPHLGGRFFGDQQNATLLNGKITAVNGNDFTLDQNGSSKTIKTDSNTRFGGVGISGLKSGDNVRVAGTANSDGSVQALSVIVTQPASSSN